MLKENKGKSVVKFRGKGIRLQALKQTCIGLGSKERTTPATSVIRCLNKQIKDVINIP